MNRYVDAETSLAEELLRHADWTRRLARSLLGDPALAEDALHDTWLSARRSPPSPDRPLTPWLRTVLRNRVLNRLRGERRRRNRDWEAGDRAEATSPEDLLGRLQTQRLLVELLSELPDPYRQTVLLRYFEGLSSAEIAAQMELPAATVRGRLKTALAELRERLERRCGGRRAWMAAIERLAQGEESDAPPRIARTLEGPVTWPLVLLLAAAATVTIGLARWRSTPIDPAGSASAGEIARPMLVTSRPPSFEGATGTERPDQEPPTGQPPAGSGAEGSSPLVPSTAIEELAISGTVTMVGPLPLLQGSDRGGDPACPADREDIVVNQEGRVANVVVRIRTGWNGQLVASREPAIIEQLRCRFHPRVLVVQPGQTIAIRNADDTLHEVQAWVGRTPLVSWSPSSAATAFELRAERPGDIIRLGCATHPSKTAHAVVSEGAHFAVTEADGRFTLAGVPRGKYRLEAWHERLGTRQLHVTVPSVAMGEANFEFGEVSRRATLSLASRDQCVIAVEGRSLVARVCQREGLKGAMKMMKAMVAVAKKEGLSFECDSCHRMDTDTDWTLLPDARRLFQELAARTP